MKNRKSINVGLIGFGTIGTGFVKILQKNYKIIKQKVGTDLVLKRIADIDTKRNRGVKVDKKILTKNANDIINDPEIDIVVELIGGYEPARTIILNAIAKKKHIVTANKALIAKHGKEIFKAVEKNKVDIYIEASVGGGVPIVQCLNEGLVANKIELIYGILNGTTNYILTNMEKNGVEFEKALKSAQEKGYAEKDPSFDIDGIDSAHKIIILSNIAFNSYVNMEDVYIEGIRKITLQDIIYADEEFGYKIKLLAIAKNTDDGLEVRVHPTLISKDHLLASVDDVYNAVYFIGDAVGSVMSYGLGAGQMPTASAVMSDVIYIARNVLNDIAGKITVLRFGGENDVKIKSIEDVICKYYVRFTAEDKPGVLSFISGILGKYKISIASVIQKERKEGEPVPIIMMTHEAKEKDIRKAIKEIDKSSNIKQKTLLIRVEK